VIAITLELARLRESFRPQAALDIPGLVIVAVAALALVWGLLHDNLAGWTSAEVISPLAAGMLFAAAFVAWELRAFVASCKSSFNRTKLQRNLNNIGVRSFIPTGAPILSGI
jgi:protein-S-isoprenylcysteine O-methyltransferase Ste14